jgi:hypothetical protein
LSVKCCGSKDLWCMGTGDSHVELVD